MGVFESDVLFWFVLGFALFIMELVTPGVFFVFFGLGAWAAMLVNLTPIPLAPWAQWALFAVVSVASLVLLRRHLIVFLAARKVSKVDSLSEPMVADRYLGQEVEVLAAISPGRPGTVEFNGTRWQAKSRTALAVGDRARSLDLDGLTFMIEPVEGGAAPVPEPPAAGAGEPSSSSPPSSSPAPAAPAAGGGPSGSSGGASGGPPAT
jgi:membrane protein implicated in regulation of membrane protease activity